MLLCFIQYEYMCVYNTENRMYYNEFRLIWRTLLAFCGEFKAFCRVFNNFLNGNFIAISMKIIKIHRVFCIKSFFIIYFDLQHIPQSCCLLYCCFFCCYSLWNLKFCAGINFYCFASAKFVTPLSLSCPPRPALLHLLFPFLFTFPFPFPLLYPS